MNCKYTKNRKQKNLHNKKKQDKMSHYPLAQLLKKPPPYF